MYFKVVHLQIDIQFLLWPGLYRQSIDHNRAIQKLVDSVTVPLKFLSLNRFCQNCIMHFIKDSNWPSNSHFPLVTFCHTPLVNIGMQQRMKTENVSMAGRESPVSLIYSMGSKSLAHHLQVVKIKYYCSRLCHFPLPQFVNEPMSHFVNGEVRLAVSCLADRIHYECRVPDNIHKSYLMGCSYDSTVTTSENPPLSNPISYSTVTPNDGDGLITNIDRSKDNPLQDAVHVRLNGIDAPEISAVHFFKTNDLSHVFIKRMGLLSLCGFHFFLRLFLLKGNAKFCEQLPKDDFDVPVDTYNPVKEYWFRFSSPQITGQEEIFKLY